MSFVLQTHESKYLNGLESVISPTVRNQTPDSPTLATTSFGFPCVSKYHRIYRVAYTHTHRKTKSPKTYPWQLLPFYFSVNQLSIRLQPLKCIFN